MNTFRTLSLLTALGLASALTAQTPAEQGQPGNRDMSPATGTQGAPAGPIPQQETSSSSTGSQQGTSSTADPDSASSKHQREVTGRGADTEAQETPPTTSSDPSAAGSPHQRETVSREAQAGDTERAAGKEQQMAGATKPKDKLVGLSVETSDGQAIGSVVDIVRDRNGQPEYAVVAIDNDTTAVPYDTVSSMVRDGKVVMSQSRLANAPKVKQTEWLDQTESQWRNDSDRYWGNTRTASPNDESTPRVR